MPDGSLYVPDPVVLSPRWTQIRHHAEQQRYVLSPHRFNVIPAGRRSGKTEHFKRKIVTKALEACFDWPARYFAGGPTRDQAKRIYWDDLKALSPPELVQDISETELYIEYVNDSRIYVLGLDKPERAEGSPWDGCGIDEFGNVKPDVWPKNVRPALSDRMGWADLFGVPEGRNHYYDVAMKARAMMKEQGAASEWGYFHWISADILPASEIEAAKRDLDELSYKQEYEASFINFEGRAYYTFDVEIHCTPLRKRYNPRAPLILMFDFNVEPGVCAIGQEAELPLPPIIGRDGKPQPVFGTMILGEVYIPRNSNTPAVCRAILKDRDGNPTIWSKHEGPVRCYGDATGGSRGSAKVEGSDWELIEKGLRPHFKQQLSFRVKDDNPAERARINAVNSRFLSQAGEIRMLVDEGYCPNVVKDFEGVTLLKGGSGELDKKKKGSEHLTHISDGIGYYIEYEFPIEKQSFERVKLKGF